MAGHEDTFHHVRDFPHFELPFGVKIELPEIPFLPSPTKLVAWMTDPDFTGSVMGLQLTKFMVLQVVAGLLTYWIFTGMVRRVRSGQAVSGRWWNFWETLALFIRDEVVRKTIGDGHHGHDDHGGGGDHGHHAAHDHGHKAVESGHPADKYLPFVWTCFFYVLWCNLLGAFPWVGSATGEINVTGALAVIAFGATIFYGSKELGFKGFWKAIAPSMGEQQGLLGLFMNLVIIPMVWVIEFIGLFIKHGVLAIRLFANIMAGHTVVAAILGFIAMDGVWNSGLYYVVTPASIFGQVAIGMMELGVAFLQAYIFSFLATLFIGTAVHPH